MGDAFYAVSARPAIRLSGHKTRAVFERYHVVERIAAARLRQKNLKAENEVPENSKAPSANAERA
jgi:hypothetical protein